MEEEICPLDNRRSPAEITLKLAVVHYTTINAYCHLLSMRGEPTRVICRKTVFFFVCPGSIIIQHILAILALVGAYVFIQFINLRDSTSLQLSPKRALVILFGKVDQHTSQPTPQNSDGRSVIKTAGRVMVVLALTAQCVGSCIVFVRRHRHDAATLGDWRVFELAIAGLLISLLTVVYLLWGSALILSPHETVELSHHRRRTYLDTTLLYLRDVPAPTDSHSHESIRTKFLLDSRRMIYNAPMIIGTVCTQPWIAGQISVRSLRTLLPGGLARVLGILCSGAAGCDECETEDKFLDDFYHAGLLTSTVTASGFVLLIESAKMLREWKRNGRLQALLQVIAVILMGAIAWGLSAMVFFLGSLPYFTFGLLVLDLVEQLELLATWPTDLDCPLLWSDPKANFLWHLM